MVKINFKFHKNTMKFHKIKILKKMINYFIPETLLCKITLKNKFYEKIKNLILLKLLSFTKME